MRTNTNSKKLKVTLTWQVPPTLHPSKIGELQKGGAGTIFILSGELIFCGGGRGFHEFHYDMFRVR